MKINIEIDDDSKFVEALAAEISRAKAAADDSKADASVGSFELKRSDESMALTCVCFSCGIA